MCGLICSGTETGGAAETAAPGGGDTGVAQHNNLMTEGNIRRKMLGFALPILAGYFFQQLYNTVDALIVGNYLDADALAAVTSTGSYVYLMVGFVAGFATGAGIIIARHIGADSPEERAAKIAAVKDIYLQLGVDADAKEEIVRFTRRAMDAVTGTGLRPIQTEALRRFAEKLVGRAK